MKALKQIKNEISEYHDMSVPMPTGEQYSEWKLKKRIYTYKNRYYPTGKINDNGEYEYWFDNIHPRVNDEIKNLRLDSRYFLIWHKNPTKFFTPVFIANSALSEFMDKTGRAEELVESNEDFSGDGNVLWRKTDKNYEKCDMLNTYLTNTLAKTVEDTAIIERFYLTQSELRKRDGLYNNVSEVIKDCGNTSYKASEKTIGKSKTTPLYEMYRRTGEIAEDALFEAMGKKGGNPDKYVLAMIIGCGLSGDKDKKEYIVFAQPLEGKMSDWFKEAHRGPYKGKWWREGLYELLADMQIAYNELTNEIMRAIPWNTSAIFRHTDVKTLNNIRRGLKRGTLINSGDIQQIQIQGRTAEAVSQRNAIIQEMDRLAGSYEVVRGVTPSSGTPLGTTQLMNENANKLYDFLRKKLAIPYREVYSEFVVPELVKELKGKDMHRLTGDEAMLNDFRRVSAENWFFQNLPAIGPMAGIPGMKEMIIEEKVAEMQREDPVLENVKEWWKEIVPGLRVTVVGENFNTAEIGTVMQLLPATRDPNMAGRMVDFVLKSKGINLPDAPVEPQQMGQTGQAPEEEGLASPLQEEPVPSEL